MIEDFDLFRKETENKIISIVGNEKFRLFCPETRIDIVTSEICFTVFKDATRNFDFSVVINPAMKALEKELKSRFYDGYMSFLKAHYSPAEYAKKVCDGQRYPGDMVAANWRRKILLYEDSRLQYQTDLSKFTIGDFRYTIGTNSVSKPKYDFPVIQYCEEELCPHFTHAEIKDWLYELVKDIEVLRKLRNDSSHAGITQTLEDAQVAINDLIEVKKVLVKIISPYSI